MSPQAGFLLQDQVLRRLISAIPQAVSFIGSEDAEELVQGDKDLLFARPHVLSAARVIRGTG